VFPVRYEHHLHIKSKAIPVTGPGGLYGRDMLIIPHYLDNRSSDGGEVSSLKRRPHSTTPKLFSLLLVLISVRGGLNLRASPRYSASSCAVVDGASSSRGDLASCVIDRKLLGSVFKVLHKYLEEKALRHTAVV
jgi:hypothetical protein